jgi:hypothetical protein
LDDADWHGEGDTPDDLSGLIVGRDLRDCGLVLPRKLQGLVHPYLLDGFLLPFKQLAATAPVLRLLSQRDRNIRGDQGARDPHYPVAGGTLMRIYGVLNHDD